MPPPAARTASGGVEKITSAVVTPLLWREETRAIHSAEASDNMTLRLRDTVSMCSDLNKCY